MSRVGKMPIPIPSGVKVQIKGSEVAVEGPKGKLAHRLPPGFKMEQPEGQLLLKRPSDEKKIKSMHGLHKTLVYNMVKGVTEGFSKQLELVGVGYKASVAKEVLNMFVGYSHPINFQVPKGITIEVPKPTQVVIKGIDKCLVGQVAAQIRGFAPPEPYKGKGIKYSDEVIRRKAGKAVA
jgi:large subunit ribosomal protein L6